MDKGIITICVDNSTTEDEIRGIRDEFSKDELSKTYKLNMLVSGTGCLKENIRNIIMAKVYS